MMKFPIAVTVLTLALAASSVQAQKQRNISESQCRKIFLSADDYQNWRMPDGTPYCEVYWDRDDDPRVLWGYVFLKTLALPDKEMEQLLAFKPLRSGFGFSACLKCGVGSWRCEIVCCRSDSFKSLPAPSSA